ncbi:hypothetical protein [Ottowia testudinis]|uniref:Uncharacterized protein n=1 Tax=Ottowia testudinis TaxID=2816950 RepID=A0A975CJQ9_9BURK|nr:hypothetical protein [Ottowia testudinis]QTD44698.1 hypothetical protein J1M35_16660 [Ottowia testudinis]
MIALIQTVRAQRSHALGKYENQLISPLSQVRPDGNPDGHKFRHCRAGGNPYPQGFKEGIPACAGMTQVGAAQA